jgi:hypothetical protein
MVPIHDTIWSRTFNTATLIVSVISALFGCVGAQAQWVPEDAKDLDEIAQGIEGWCEERVQLNPAILQLKNKLPLLMAVDNKLHRVTPDMFLDMVRIQDMPTDQEIEPIRAWSAANSSCENHILDAFREHEPAMTGLFEKTYFKLRRIRSDLIKKNISYGAANREFARVMLEHIESRDRVLSQQVRPTPAPPSIEITNCMWVGNMFSCFSF